MLLTLLFLIGALQPVPQEDYNHAVDYIGWQVMDAYMKDYTVLRPDRAAEAKGYEVFKEEFPAGSYGIENPPESETVKQVLSSNNWNNANKGLYSRIINWKSMYDADWNGQDAADYLRGQIKNISLKTLGVDDSAYTNLQITKAQLQDEIAQYFAPAAAATTAAIDDSPQEAYDIPEGYEQEDHMVATEDTNNSFSLFSSMAEGQNWLDYRVNIISLGLILLLSGLLIYLFTMFKKMDERLDKHRKEINDLKSEAFILGRKLNDLGGDSKLQSRLAALESKLNKIGPDHRPQESGKIKTTNTVYTPTHAAVATKPKVETFYLSTPNSDGSFNVSSMSASYKPTASIYKFEVSEEDGEIATFTVADQYEAIKDALSSPGSYLDPVCESENAFSPAARKIVNVRPGRAYRRGEQWMVRQEDKAIIRYE